MLLKTVLYFFIYAFFGWCCEVVFAALTQHKLVNRGFLNGPICPIYGIGMLLVLGIMTPISNSLPFLFVGSAVLASAAEFVTGLILEKLFNKKWWDYSERPFNLKGYICLEFSVLWGAVCTLAIRTVHPGIAFFVAHIPFAVSVTCSVLLTALTCVDICLTVSTVIKLRRTFSSLEKLGADIRHFSDTLAEGLYEGTCKGVHGIEKINSIKETIKTKNEDNVAKFKDRLASVNCKSIRGYERIARAFPSVKEHLESSRRHLNELAEKLKHNLPKK